tara:strand:+ start:342 stop:509 length:168 start_codon:yes stop_codon:yes gene_type:complete
MACGFYAPDGAYIFYAPDGPMRWRTVGAGGGAWSPMVTAARIVVLARSASATLAA